MAVLLPSKSSEHSFSISNLVLRFRSKKGTRTKVIPSLHGTGEDRRPPLIPAPLPLVLTEHQATLPTLGWTTITFPELTAPEHHEQLSTDAECSHSISTPHPLQLAYQDLFAASQAFFNLPDAQKTQWKHKLVSEEGWTKIPGEKEFITLRTLENCPDNLKGPAKRYWDLMGAHLSTTLGRISTSLGMLDGEDGGLRKFIGPCGTMQKTDKEKTATMLRLFRYEGWNPKVVAEPHADLGLLSVVVGNVPGLEVWDGCGWFEVEKEVERAGKKGASILVGKQLERLSCGRYGAGGHRVVSYGAPTNNYSTVNDAQATSSSPSGDQNRYRFSIVFVLRAHEPILINSDDLETDITGKWAESLVDVTAGKLYEQIRRAHYNINIGLKDRDRQRKGIERVKHKEG